MKRLSALFILIISSCSLKADYDVKQLILEQICGLFSVIAHETGHALTNERTGGNFPELIIGFPDNTTEKWNAIEINKTRGGQLTGVPISGGKRQILSFNSAGIIGGHTDCNPSSLLKDIAICAAGPLFGATADFIMATAIEFCKNRNNKYITKKEILAKALDRAAPSMINHLANLIIPFSGSDGHNILKSLKLDTNIIQFAMIFLGITATTLLQTEVSAESAERHSKYRMKPASLFFAATESSKIGYAFASKGHAAGIGTIQDTYELLNHNKIAAYFIFTTWFPIPSLLN